MHNKKEQIFHAVLEHIKKEGLLSNITVAQIAKDADVGKGTVYEYFKSKEEIITETIIFMLETMSDRISSQLKNELGFEDNLRLHIKSTFEILKSNSSFHSLLMSQDVAGLINQELRCKITQKIFELQKKYHIFMKNIIDKGTNENLFKELKDEYVLSMICQTVINSAMYYIQKSMHQEESLSLNDCTDKTYQLIVKMIK